MDQAELNRYKSLLDEEKRRLEGELKTFASKDPRMKGDWDARFPQAEGNAPPASHSSLEEQADLREEYESALAQEQSLEGRLLEVDKALERIAAGAFGACLSCREPIPRERLEANPAAAYHIEHETKE